VKLTIMMIITIVF